MATATFIPVEEYLHTVYRPDVDYVDGELQERNLGEQWHGLVQAAVLSALREKRREWGIRVLPEQRIQVTASRFRVPDVCVVPASAPIVSVLHTPPMLCVEVLSPEDRFSRTLERVREYIRMGVSVVWIIDPMSRDIWTVASNGDPVRFTGGSLLVAGTDICVRVAELFVDIDEAPQP